jgi:dipeptidyl aminopeptidase/acylaminoacyl peptidase
VARGETRLNEVAFGPYGAVYWAERRPSEGGRNAVVRLADDGRRVDLLPPAWNVRSRVHEYGGGAWTPAGESGLVFANWADQRLYLLSSPGVDPQPLTPEPVEPQGDRYADLVLAPGGSEVICVCEHVLAQGRDVRREIAAVALDGSRGVRTLVVDGHFLSNPRPSPDGRHLSWLTWDHPRMPWDGTELRVAEIGADGSIGTPRTLLGGDEESVFQPDWVDPGTLIAVSDRSGWWNPYKVDLEGGLESLCEREEEFGRAQWVFGMATYGLLGDGRVAVLHGRGTWGLSLLDPEAHGLSELSGACDQFTYFEAALAVHDRTVLAVGGGPQVPLSVISVDALTGDLQVLRRSTEEVPDSDYLPLVQEEQFGGPGGRDVHAFVYAPRNPRFSPAEFECPPYLLIVHGGPTAQASPVLDLEVAYFTSRGIGVVAVDYGGSTGYGREYRRRLCGRWGVLDVEDVVAVARGLVERGQADRRKLLVRGASAGGWTVLAALTRTEVFAGGVSYYGVADLVGLAEDTHDFEAHYVDGLVGPLPEARDVYEERSPLSHLNELHCPILLLQGTEDRIVPPKQAEMMRDAMARRGIAHAYIAFAGEQHGFRRAETVERALEAELSFYGQVTGFDPPDVPVLPLTREATR